MKFEKILSQADSVVADVKYRAENLFNSASDTAEAALDNAAATFIKAYVGTVAALSYIKWTGLVIASITAPVPTFIAMAMFWLMEISLESVKNNVDGSLKDRKKKREFDRVVSVLKKYGKIPQKAIVETNLVRMQIDSGSGFVDGVIISGAFKDVLLSDLDDDSLISMASTTDDKDTKALLESYVSFRRKSNSINKGSA